MLCYHVQTWTSQAKSSVAATRPGALKILNTAVDVDELASWRQAVPNGMLVYRQVFGGGDSQDVNYRCDTLLSGLAPIAHLGNIVVEVPWNEEHEDNAADLAAYAEMTNQAVAILEADGYSCAVGNFSTGQPNLSLWPSYYPALAPSARKKYLSLHEYSAPTMQTNQSWECLRYRQVYASLPAQYRLPLLVTECGIDWGVIPGKSGGWQSNTPTTAAAYAAQLGWYAQALAQDGAIGFIFEAGAYSDFVSFDVGGVPEVQTIVQQYGGIPVTYTVGTGFQRAVGLIGPWTESETYDDPGLPTEVSKVSTPLGYATWSAKTNETVVHCNDGRLYADGGNHGNGTLVEIRGPFA